MAIIRHPLSGQKGILEISLYKEYAGTSYDNLEAKRYFEAVVTCSIGVDVLLNTLPDRLLALSSGQLDSDQIAALNNIENSKLTSGQIIRKFAQANILDRRLIRALECFNEKRNNVVHPFQRGQLKPEAITPSSTTEEYARNIYRMFCHVIDLAAGRSPRKEAKELDQYVKWRRQIHAAHFGKNK